MTQASKNVSVKSTLDAMVVDGSFLMLNKVLEIGKSITARINVKPSSRQDQFQLGLLAKSLEILSSIVELEKFEKFGSIPILIRSMLEGVVDIKMSQLDENYLRHLVAQDYKYKYKALKHFRENPDSEILNYMFSTTEAIKQVESDYALVTEKVKEFGVTNYSIAVAFKKIGNGDFYYTIYNYLCKYTHNNPDQIAKSYFESEDGHLKRIKVFKPYEASELKTFDILAGRMFYQTIKSLTDYFKLDFSDDLKEIDRLISVRNNDHGV